ncbi:MAG: YIP1 family protein [Candidatus Bathyarchaeia archaeon]
MESEEKPAEMFAYGIFKVLYSPIEAFKNIVKKPNIKGPLLIMLLVSICFVGRAYISFSKVFYQKNGLDVSLIQTEMAGVLITNFIIDALFVFILKWGIHAAVFIMILMVFRLGKISWKELFIALGYTFSVAIIYYGLSVPLTMTLQPVYTNMSLQDVNQTRVNQLVWEKWSTHPASYAINYLSIVIYVWTAILSCIAIRFLYEFDWKKAGIVTALASFMNFFLTLFFNVFP